MQRLIQRILMSIILGSTLLLITQCSPPTAEPVSQEAPIPPGIEVVNIDEDEITVNEIMQHKVLDQCGAASPLKTQIRFSQSESREAQQELVLEASLGGEVGISTVAKAELGASIQQHFASSIGLEKTHGEEVQIEVPPHTKQEYTLVWHETRREGTVQYTENGVSKTANYSYRIGLELVSTKGENLPCPGQEIDTFTPAATPAPTATSTWTPTPTATPTWTPLPTPTMVPDTDEDGLNDDEEQKHSTDPMNSDTDGDGLSDGDEVNIHNTKPNDWDTDGDKMPDGYELELDTDPTKPPNCQPPLADGQEYVVQAGDRLSKVTDKFLGNPLAYPSVIYYTNLMHAEDPTYAILGIGSLDPGLESGWKIWIPGPEAAEAYLNCQ